MINISHYFNSNNIDVSNIPSEWYLHEKIKKNKTEENIKEILNLTKKNNSFEKNEEKQVVFIDEKDKMDNSNMENLNLVLNNIKKHLNVPMLNKEKGKEKKINSESFNNFLISFNDFLFDDKKMDFKDLPFNEDSVKIVNLMKSRFLKKEKNSKDVFKKYNEISYNNIRSKNKIKKEIEIYKRFLEEGNEDNSEKIIYANLSKNSKQNNIKSLIDQTDKQIKFFEKNTTFDLEE